MKVSAMVNDISYTEIGRKGINTILVPTDFSEPSDAALQIAIDLAKQQNARLYLLHVVPFRQAANEMEMMQKQLAKFPELKPVEIIQEIRKGKIHEEILKAQIEKNVDLIVIARHGKKTLLHTFFPSVTEKVKKTAQCSVLVVGF
jgi:universal stress protein A